MRRECVRIPDREGKQAGHVWMSSNRKVRNWFKDFIEVTFPFFFFFKQKREFMIRATNSAQQNQSRATRINMDEIG